jgi:hypothetical protein
MWESLSHFCVKQLNNEESNDVDGDSSGEPRGMPVDLAMTVPTGVV